MWILKLFLGVAAVASIDGMDAMPLVSLHEPSTRGEVSLESAIRQRRSERQFSKRALSLADVGQLLWAAQGITGRDGARAAPSAGALYPLEVYVVAGAIDSLPAGVYRYRSRGHRLEAAASGDLRDALAKAAAGQSWVRKAPAVLVIAGVYERSAKKYGQRARRYTHMEVGHAAQNVYLQAETLGLGTVVVGAFDEAAVQRILGLPSDHLPIALMPVGHPR